MNDLQKGSYRDKRVVELVNQCQALDAEQISTLLFSYHRTAQKRLKRLYEAKRLKRCRLSQDAPFVYYIDQRPGQLEHLLMTNWIYIWTLARLRNWEELTHWSYEAECGPVRADAFLGILNRVTGEHRFVFVEVDRAGSRNGFDKVERYNRLYEAEGYNGQWWVKYTKHFPTVLCVTDSESRLTRIQKAIAQDNVNGLRFNARILADMRKEAAHWEGRPLLE